MSHNFLGLANKNITPESAEVFILPIPYDGTVSYRPGARDGADAIINASEFVELYDYELGRDISEIGIHTLEEIEPEMHGPQKMAEVIRKTVSEILKKDKFLVSLGGEHSITIGLARAFAKKYDNLSVLQLDAHADLRNSYMGTEYSHASTMRRVIEIAQTVQVGLRSFSEEDIEVIKKENLKIIKAEEVLFGDNWIDGAIEALTENVYITLDLDVFDPSVMPSTGTPEPGGLGWYRVLRLLKKVSEKRKIVGFDIVELAPIPGNVAPDFLAAKLACKMIGYSVCKR